MGNLTKIFEFDVEKMSKSELETEIRHLRNKRDRFLAVKMARDADKKRNKDIGNIVAIILFFLLFSAGVFR